MRQTPVLALQPKARQGAYLLDDLWRVDDLWRDLWRGERRTPAGQGRDRGNQREVTGSFRSTYTYTDPISMVMLCILALHPCFASLLCILALHPCFASKNKRDKCDTSQVLRTRMTVKIRRAGKVVRIYKLFGSARWTSIFCRVFASPASRKITYEITLPIQL